MVAKCKVVVNAGWSNSGWSNAGRRDMHPLKDELALVVLVKRQVGQGEARILPLVHTAAQSTTQ